MKAADIPPCEDGKEHSWEEIDLFGCEVCGDHPGLTCPDCYETLDLVWDEDPRGI